LHWCWRRWWQMVSRSLTASTISTADMSGLKKSSAAWVRRFDGWAICLPSQSARVPSRPRLRSSSFPHLSRHMDDQDSSLREQLSQALLGGGAHVDTLAALKDFPSELYGVIPENAPHSAWE